MVLKLKEVLKRKNIMSKDLATQIGVTDMTISNWITGKTFPSIEMLDKISKALGVPVWYLFASENDLLDIHKSLRTNVFICPNCGAIIEISLKQKTPSNQ